jgi:hypothetical protein
MRGNYEGNCSGYKRSRAVRPNDEHRAKRHRSSCTVPLPASPPGDLPVQGTLTGCARTIAASEIRPLEGAETLHERLERREITGRAGLAIG